MTEDQKREWEAYDVLRRAATERFNGRRKYEYRILLIFWTAIAALIVLLLRQEVKEWHHAYAVWALVMATFSFIAWILWTVGLRKAHEHDRCVSRFFEEAMMKSVGLKFSDDIKKQADIFKTRRSILSYWSLQLQLAITALLLVAFALVAWTKNEPPQPPAPVPATQSPERP
jgi:hypothetical protein